VVLVGLEEHAVAGADDFDRRPGGVGGDVEKDVAGVPAGRPLRVSVSLLRVICTGAR